MSNSNHQPILTVPKGSKVLSFGELLLRICPDAAGDWLRENNLSAYVGGAEANVATALAIWEVPSAYFTAVPDNLLARQVTGYLQGIGIDVSPILYQGNRLGLYFLHKGKDLKHAGVIYDRAYSSFSELQPASIDWDKVLEGVGWLHFSAITPALSNRLAQVCEEALRAAASRNIKISVDLNYRAKLWQYGASPAEIMPGLVHYCDVIMGNVWAAEKMLGIPVDASLVESGRKEDFLRQAKLTSERIVEQFPKAAVIANTFRFDSGATGIDYYTTLFTERQLYTSAHYAADKIVDKVGSGDCFMAGLIYGLYLGHPMQNVLEFATAAAFRKLFIASDATHEKAETIEASISKAAGSGPTDNKHNKQTGAKL